MRHVGVDRRRYGHPNFGAGYWLVLSGLAVALPALDWGTHTHLEYRLAGRFARVHFCYRSESCLRSGGLPAGAQFRQHLACPGVSDEVANPFSGFYQPAVRPMRLFRRHLSRGNAGCCSAGGNSPATMENTLGDGGDWFGSRLIFVDLFADHPSGFGIPAARALAVLSALPTFGTDSARLWSPGVVPTPTDANGPQIWIWIGLLLAGIIVAVILQRTRARQPAEPEAAKEYQPGAVRPGTVLCHKHGSGNHRAFWLPAESPVFHAAMVLRRNPDSLRYLSRRDLNCELAGAPSVGIAAHCVLGSDDDIKCATGVGGSAHPSEQCRSSCRVSQPECFSERPHRGPERLGGYHV